MKIERSDLISHLVYALLGEIYESVIAITFKYNPDEKYFKLVFYLDRPSTEDDYENIRCVITEFISNYKFSDFDKLEDECIYVTNLSQIDVMDGIVFRRKINNYSNYIEGTGVLNVDAQKLLDGANAGKYNVLRKHQNRAVVNFKKNIGLYYKNGKIVGPTSYGLIHFGKEGAHIIPANPNQYFTTEIERNELISSLASALLGEIYESIIAITFKYNPDEKYFKLVFYLDRPPTEDDYENIGCVITEFISNYKFSDFDKLEDECIYVTNLSQIDVMDGIVFRRTINDAI